MYSVLQYVISCSWLSAAQMIDLCAQLDALWEENKGKHTDIYFCKLQACSLYYQSFGMYVLAGSEVVYEWVCWLKTQAVLHLCHDTHDLDLDFPERHVSVHRYEETESGMV
jgi:hypothetical protein